MNKINISIDDISPHPNSSTNVLKRCFEVIDKIPEVKFSLFIPVSYWRTQKANTITSHPLQINFFPEFCNEIKNLPSENFEICYHGFYHGIPGKSDNDEFQYLNYEQAIERFNAMFKVVKLSNLENVFKKIFRPPAWRMSPEAIQAAKDVGIELLALSPKEYAKITYKNEDEKFPKVVYYNVNPPFDPLKVYKQTEIVYHACEWDKNYMSTDMTKELISFLLENKKKNLYCFLEEM